MVDTIHTVRNDNFMQTYQPKIHIEVAFHKTIHFLKTSCSKISVLGSMILLYTYSIRVFCSILTSSITVLTAASAVLTATTAPTAVLRSSGTLVLWCRTSLVTSGTGTGTGGPLVLRSCWLVSVTTWKTNIILKRRFGI